MELCTSKGRHWSSEGVRPVGASCSESAVPDIRLSKGAWREPRHQSLEPNPFEVCSVQGRNWTLAVRAGRAGFLGWSKEVLRCIWRLTGMTAGCGVNRPHLEAPWELFTCGVLLCHLRRFGSETDWWRVKRGAADKVGLYESKHRRTEYSPQSLQVAISSYVLFSVRKIWHL
jgi:hypothetical protein